jgi:hypothetical protein
MRLPLQMLRPSAAQKRQIACCTNRGNTLGNRVLKALASIWEATARMISAQPTVAEWVAGCFGKQEQIANMIRC